MQPARAFHRMSLMGVSDRRLLTLVGVVAVLVAVNAVLACINTGELHETLNMVSHTHEVIATLEHTLASTLSAETEQRGYLITRDTACLDQYHLASGDVEQALNSLDHLVDDNRDQLARAALLREQTKARFQLLDEGVAAIRGQGFDLARQVVMNGHGKEAMDAARATVDQMRDAENRLLDRRRHDARLSRSIAIGSAIASGLIALLALGGFSRLLRRQMRERAEAAANLNAEKELFRTTLASIGDGMITTDTGARVTFLNGVAQSLTGWTQADAAGEKLETVFHIVNEDSGDVVANPALRALREGVVVGLANHTLLRTRAGEEHPIDDSAAPIRDESGTIIGSVLVFRDVTSRRDAERALREADSRKDRFLALLAHELRNPLAPMRNSLEIMRLTQNPEHLAQVRGVLERQLTQMVRLVDDLLDVSRIASNKHEMRLQTVDIADVVASALETFRPVLEQCGQQLVKTLPGEPVHVRADPIRLAQVLYNLLNNASKFSPHGSRIVLDVTRTGDQVALRVRDQGVGIPPGMIEEIFEMFVQVDQSLERSRSGLGVGLTLVRRLVAMHGGTVRAHSEGAGKGSEFVVTLPTVVAAPGSDAPAEPLPAVSGRKVLVADDNRDAAESLARLLRLRGHEVRTVHDGRSAVRETEAFQPHIVLLDIGMPELNGYDTARAIRAQLFGRERLLVAVTGWGGEDDKRRTREAGFDHHLVKPVELSMLEDLMRQAAEEAQA
jgi:PAS domain S-box-containing protein